MSMHVIHGSGPKKRPPSPSFSKQPGLIGGGQVAPLKHPPPDGQNHVTPLWAGPQFTPDNQGQRKSGNPSKYESTWAWDTPKRKPNIFKSKHQSKGAMKNHHPTLARKKTHHASPMNLNMHMAQAAPPTTIVHQHYYPRMLGRFSRRATYNVNPFYLKKKKYHRKRYSKY